MSTSLPRGRFRGKPPLLTYGVSFALLSSFGQTFLLSLFVPALLAEFVLSDGEFGLLYSAATLASGVLLPWSGRWVDRARLTRFSLVVVALMACSALLMAVAWHVAVLWLALAGLRLSGQGLSTHTTYTVMARYFEEGRGRALSISSLGFPLGEAVLPFLVALSIGWIGWRPSWVLIALVVGLAFGPVLLVSLRRSEIELDPRKLGGAADASPKAADSSAGTADPPPVADSRPGDWSRRQVLGDARFWFVLPAALLPSFWVTGLFLYQSRIAEAKGWSLALMASAFVGFALTRVVSSLLSGGVVDRFSARHVYPFFVLPVAGGMGLLIAADGVWAAYGFMACIGMTLGMSGLVQAALWVELYGVRELGAIKAMMASLTVLGAAGSPVVVGFLLDRGIELDRLLWWGIATILAGSVLALKIFPAPSGEA